MPLFDQSLLFLIIYVLNPKLGVCIPLILFINYFDKLTEHLIMRFPMNTISTF